MLNLLFSVAITYLIILNIISGILKINAFNYFVVNTKKLLNFNINYNFLRLLLGIFIFLEISSSVIFFLYGYNPFIIYTILLLYLVSTFSILPHINQKEIINCGCFGNMFLEKISITKVLVNISAMLFFIYYLLHPNTYMLNIYVFVLAIFLIIFKFINMWKSQEIK